jgi:hypothetical protein
MTKYPNTRYGWYLYYMKRYNKFLNPQAADLAMTYLLLHLTFDAEESE